MAPLLEILKTVEGRAYPEEAGHSPEEAGLGHATENTFALSLFLLRPLLSLCSHELFHQTELYFMSKQHVM